MKNVKNMYRVQYQACEGNNYAGGFVSKSKDVDTIEEAVSINRIESITPIEIKLGNAMSKAEITAAINAEIQATHDKYFK